jgi:thiamine transporter
MTGTRTRVLVEVALTVALAAVLHYVRIWQMPFGGTVSLEMLPILVLGLRRGPVAGLVAGVLFGFVDFLFEPFFVHWVQLFLDYPIAFAAVGAISGLWAPLWRRLTDAGRTSVAVSWVVPAAVVTASIGRYVAHFVSGVVFFATAAMGGPLANGQSAFADPAALVKVSAYSAVYNLYVPASAAACLVGMLVLMPVLERAVPVRRMR